MNRNSKTTSEPDLNAIVDRFEESWSKTGDADILDFIPSVECERHGEILCELIRLDLEFRWSAGQKPRVEDYLSRFADSNLALSQVEQLAFEEYRVRFQAGQTVPANDYARRLGIDTSKWPVWSRAPQDGSRHSQQRKFGKDQVSSSSKFEPKSISFPEVGSIFHGFDIVGQLGEGAFGRVFLARQVDLSNRFVALKVTEESDIEPLSLARLQHTNIIPIYSLKKRNGVQSICMPFLGVATMRDLFQQSRQTESLQRSGKELISTVAGKRTSTIVATVDQSTPAELHAIVNRGGDHGESMPAIAGLSYQQTALWMVGRVADGLAYAHSRGVVHGDLKPANILISDDGEPLILDFHLALSGEKAKADSLVGGTLPYMSAQHIRSLQGDAVVDESCDVFSLGVVLYESLTGVLPYEVHRAEDLAFEHSLIQRKETPASIRSHNPALSQDVASIVAHCLNPRKELRYSAARELQTDIERHLSDLPLKFAPNRSLVERTKKWVRRHPAISSTTSMAVMAMVMIGIAGALVYGRLSNASAIEAENASSQFVAALDEARLPLSLRHDQNADLSLPIQHASNVVQARTGGDADRYAEKLDSLPIELRSIEQRQLASAEYWLAYRLLNMADATSDQQEKDRILDTAINGLDFVVVVSHESTPTPLLELKATLLERQKHQKLADQIRASIPLSKKVATIPERILQAAELRRDDRQRDAIQALQELVGEQPDIYEAWMLMGRAYSSLKEFDKAEVCYATGIQLNRDGTWGYFHRGVDYLLRHQLKAAKSDFDSVLERDPNDATAYLNRALAFRGMQQFDAAVADLTQAIEIGAPETRAYYLRHQMLAKLQRNDEAQADLDQFLELEPRDEISWLARGMAQIRIDKPELALSDFEAALRMNPKSVNAYQNIATVQAEFLERTEDAVAAMTKITELEPDNLIAFVTRGVLSARLGNRPAALADAKFVLGKSSSADIMFRSAGVFALTSRSDPVDAKIAMDLLNKASFKDPRLVLSQVSTDPDLEPIRKLEDYQNLLKRLGDLAPQKRK